MHLEKIVTVQQPRTNIKKTKQYRLRHNLIRKVVAKAAGLSTEMYVLWREESIQVMTGAKG